jgi:hypothetical protein
VHPPRQASPSASIAPTCPRRAENSARRAPDQSCNSRALHRPARHGGRRDPRHDRAPVDPPRLQDPRRHYPHSRARAPRGFVPWPFFATGSPRSRPGSVQSRRQRTLNTTRHSHNVYTNGSFVATPPVGPSTDRAPVRRLRSFATTAMRAASANSENRRRTCHAIATPTINPPFERSSKRRKGFPSETRVKRGHRLVRGRR